MPTISAETLESQIAHLAARAARPAVAHVDPSVPFALLGIDSLGLLELAASIEESLGIPVPPELIVECTDVRALARTLAGGARPSSSFAANGQRDAHGAMLDDGVLPDTVRPRLRSRHAGGLAQARRILLTGATGFLGSWIARELLAGSGAELICFARSGAASARDRVCDRLVACGVDPADVHARVHVVEGDLARPQLGMTQRTLDRMAQDVDAVCHAGAVVSWSQPYDALRAANVHGTLELIRIASAGGAAFHFVSSVSVCYSTTGPKEVDEDLDPAPGLRGVHLGYAQSKAVAEMLVRQAGLRGLPVAIYRPALISGHSLTGDFNPDDIVARLIAGCVRMGTAPDLDWTLDALPVDTVARQIVDLSRERGVFHLVHSRPRHWRECVLWMRLYGYPIRLIPYHAWLQQLERDTEVANGASDHPLRALRPFFLARPRGAGGLTLPELYEEGHRARVTNAATSRALAGGPCPPPLDAELLHRYFDAFVNHGYLPPPRSKVSRARSAGSGRDPMRPAWFTQVLSNTGQEINVEAARRLDGRAQHSIIGELTSWRSSRPTGVFRYQLDLRDRDRGRRRREVIVKIKARDEDAMAVGEALAHTCDPAIGRAWARWGDRLGLSGAQAREIAIYRQPHPAVARHVPVLLGTSHEDDGSCALLIEPIADAVLLDAVDRPAAWTPAHVDAAIAGLARLHAVWHGREAELLHRPWIGFVPDAASISEMSDLWRALASHAAPAFCAWADPQTASIQRRLIDEVDRWWPALDRVPRTLIHHDFNPRNVCLRQTAGGLDLCAYDWELASIGSPTRDLAELLCFVLQPDAADEEIDALVMRYRTLLSNETGATIDAGEWRAAFASALYDVMLRRLPIYALVNRVRRQPFLPAVVYAWRRLYARFPLGSRS